MQGRSETLGHIFGLLYLRAISPEKGLSQKQITSLTCKSKSTVSRILELLVNQGFCDYKLEDNEKARAERLYFIKGSFKETAIARSMKGIEDTTALKNNLKMIAEDMPLGKINRDQELLERIELFTEFIDVLILTYKRTIDIFQDHYKNGM